MSPSQRAGLGHQLQIGPRLISDGSALRESVESSNVEVDLLVLKPRSGRIVNVTATHSGLTVEQRFRPFAHKVTAKPAEHAAALNRDRKSVV